MLGEQLFHGLDGSGSVGSQPLYGLSSGILITDGLPSGPGDVSSSYTITVVPYGQLSYIHLASCTFNLTQPREAGEPNLLNSSYSHWFLCGE